MHTPSLEWAAPPSVQPCVLRLWVASYKHGAPGIRAHVLPSRHMHLVLRLSGPPLRVFAHSDQVQPTSVHGPVVGGARSRFYVKELSGNVVAVGVVLRPGASLALFGVSADDLADHATPSEYRALAPANASHVPQSKPREFPARMPGSISFKTMPRWRITVVVIFNGDRR